MRFNGAKVYYEDGTSHADPEGEKGRKTPISVETLP